MGPVSKTRILKLLKQQIWSVWSTNNTIGIVVNSSETFYPIRLEELVFITCAMGWSRRGYSPGITRTRFRCQTESSYVHCEGKRKCTAQVYHACVAKTRHVVVLMSLYRWSTLSCKEHELDLLYSPKALSFKGHVTFTQSHLFTEQSDVLSSCEFSQDITGYLKTCLLLVEA